MGRRTSRLSAPRLGVHFHNDQRCDDEVGYMARNAEQCMAIASRLNNLDVETLDALVYHDARLLDGFGLAERGP